MKNYQERFVYLPIEAFKRVYLAQAYWSVYDTYWIAVVFLTGLPPPQLLTGELISEVPSLNSHSCTGNVCAQYVTTVS